MLPGFSTVIYLHGFNSSPHSYKASFLGSFLQSHAYDCNYIVPELPVSPYDVDIVISDLINRQLALGSVALIGSSLGGYYAIHFAEKFGLSAALINPAVKPYELLGDYLGENTNFHTGERYILKKAHMSELLALDVSVVSHPECLFLLTQTADQTLDYREAVEKLPASPAWIEYGGSHEFTNFQKVIPSMLAYLKINKSA